jgi:hypothetical protein
MVPAQSGKAGEKKMSSLHLRVPVDHYVNVGIPAQVAETTRHIVRWGLDDLKESKEKLMALNLAMCVLLSGETKEVDPVREMDTVTADD